ncbi:vacuolar protein sorting-associated protein VTA1 homolog [Pomacea canaliculata]|uniref:vacuolar protein sorting-associated protein VTA1 homolog n=1 Tax=Pomacea canaliculata TaxID=400727 RepID=UPI000D73C442|nr:vacuolar protein sorting-associated protein VTA1 homolog [Pomacea canaliculata]
MAATVPSVPASLRQIQHYMKTAAEHDKRDVVVAYYCRLYALQKAMEIDKKSPEARQFLVSLMDYLEKVKKEHPEEAIHNEVVGQAHMENYALKVFLYADNEDRAGRFTKNVVKSFYTAGMLFDVLGTFGELSEDLVKNQKYAKWKAAYIHRCLKNGETPLPGPMLDEYPDSGIGIEDFSQPGSSFLEAPGGMFPTPGVHAPPTTPQDPPAAAYTPQPANPPLPTPRKSPPQEIVPDWQPPPNPAGVQLTALHYQKAIKFCKYASSAMQYEDAATAIDNLSKALRILTTGKDV